MGRYINWADVVARYSNASDIGGSTVVGSTYIGYSEAEIEGMLGSSFTVPFSSNNLTAEDLCIDLTFAKIIKFKDSKKYKDMMNDIKERVNDLKTGISSMVTNSGDLVHSSGYGDTYSSTEQYQNAFDMNDAEDSWIDVDMQEDQFNERN